MSRDFPNHQLVRSTFNVLDDLKISIFSGEVTGSGPKQHTDVHRTSENVGCSSFGRPEDVHWSKNGRIK